MATIVAPSVIAQAAYNAGFRGHDLETMTAIVLSEQEAGNPNPFIPRHLQDERGQLRPDWRTVQKRGGTP